MLEKKYHFASVGLGVSGSHDLGEIACEIACSLMMLIPACYLWLCDMRNRDAGDEAISESHKGMVLTPLDRSSVNSLLLRSQNTSSQPPTPSS